MSLRSEIIRVLATGDAGPRALAAAIGVSEGGALNARLSELKSAGKIVRRDGGDGKGAIWGLPQERPARSVIAAPTEPSPDDTEVPSAHAVALAVVASARITGEDPLTIADPKAWLRLRFPVIKALRVFYPACAWDRLGALVGLAAVPGTIQPRVQSAEKAKWWPDIGDAAFEAAVEALEMA